jgi:hypothetical protein
MSNNAFVDAFVLDGSVSVANQVEAAVDCTTFTAEGGEPDTAGSIAAMSAWWKITPATDGFLTLDTRQTTEIAGGGTDTVLGLYTGAAVGALALVADDDEGGAVGALYQNTSMLTGIPVTGGVMYHIKVDSFGPVSVPMIFVLAWTLALTPAPVFADNFTDANGTTLATHVPDIGAGWGPDFPGSIGPTGLVINTNQIHDTHLLANNGSAYASAAPLADFEIEFKYTHSGAGGSTFSVGARVDDTGAPTHNLVLTVQPNWSEIWIQYDDLSFVTAGTDIAGWPMTIGAGALSGTHTIIWRAVGDTHEVFLDGVSMAAASIDAHVLGAGSFGIAMAMSAGTESIDVDYVKIRNAGVTYFWQRFVKTTERVL